MTSARATGRRLRTEVEYLCLLRRLGGAGDALRVPLGDVQEPWPGEAHTSLGYLTSHEYITRWCSLHSETEEGAQHHLNAYIALLA